VTKTIKSDVFHNTKFVYNKLKYSKNEFITRDNVYNLSNFVKEFYYKNRSLAIIHDNGDINSNGIYGYYKVVEIKKLNFSLIFLEFDDVTTQQRHNILFEFNPNQFVGVYEILISAMSLSNNNVWKVVFNGEKCILTNI
jgi:hypothetical protein